MLLPMATRKHKACVTCFGKGYYLCNKGDATCHICKGKGYEYEQSNRASKRKPKSRAAGKHERPARKSQARLVRGKES